MALVPTAIVAPQPRTVLVKRTALDGLTRKVAESRLTTIIGHAGSGKTTAALQWFESLRKEGRPALWVAVRAGIRDLPSFLLAVKEAGRAAGLDWPAFDASDDVDIWLARLAVQYTDKLILIVDDAQLLPPDVWEFLSALVAGARDAITTILISRAAIAIPISRIRALGFLVEVGPADLRLGPEEATQLVSRVAGIPIDAEAMRKIVEEMDGWASGLVMAGENYLWQKARGGNWKPPSESLHAELTSYFQEEVVADLPDRIRRFLLETSVLTELTPSTCAAVMADESARETLDMVYRGGLFLTAVEDKRHSYVYHPLFRKMTADFMAERMPELAVELHRRASLCYAENGDGLLALQHAQMTRDREFIADRLDSLANRMINAGYLYYIDELATDLPWSVLSTRPMLLLALAWRRTRSLAYATAERFINAAAEIAEREPDNVLLGHLVRHRRLVLESARDNLHLVEADAGKLLLELGDDQPYLSCTLVAQLMSARRELYHFNDILKLEAETKRALARPGSEFASIALKATVAPTLVEQGKTAVARQFLEEALSYAEEHVGRGSSVAAVPALPLAELLYDAGDLGRSAQLIDQYQPVIRQWGLVDEVAAGYIVRARLACARSDMAEALAGLEEAHLVAIECGLDRLRALVVAEQVRVLVKTGQVAAAEAALLAGDIRVDEEPVPTLTPTKKNEAIAIAWIRIEIQRHHLARAQKVATRWFELAKRNGAKRSMVIFYLLLAEIAVQQGDRFKARRAVRGAIELAEPCGWIRIFLDEGEVICSLLSETYGCKADIETPADVFASRIVSFIHGEPVLETDDEDDDVADSCLMSGMADREKEILTMVAGGLRNREIGERLGLTEGTVKWYLQQVYDKLGVRRRSQAALRAKRLGLFV
ncbi:LuxR C-terminal-related transcriptional regulator [Novosphingobium sp. KN65.2]|uniref:LuxR C-terminal-related transcriptional regulator n=1 Tax=Novosphingobium sp. KN65.2 TaxID=1478134 RepID=UPI0005E6FD7B|nr:LuxR C-terminal-related transcriptional regulator [Novosphingobium sp. KN65.2]CDO36448.1 Regulatory protein, LuxR [Novosphingobium sp. KN65.2]